ncbi:MAG: endonuclease V [Actinobacteria bacterium]|nr:endonuclease V [Actinomycetota bacterium]
MDETSARDTGAWSWPDAPEELEALQRRLAAAADEPGPWAPGSADDLTRLTAAAVFAAFPRGEGGPGAAGQPVVAAAVLWRGGRILDRHVLRGLSGGPYAAGLLALRCGPLLEAAVLGLSQRPDVVLADATGRDHPRRAGLALHLGARLDLPSVGVTNRVLLGEYEEPGDERGSSTPLLVAGETVGYAVRTRAGARPVLAHAAWRTSPEAARDVLLALSAHWRTPRPLRAARTLARTARAAGSPPGVDGP